MEALLQELDEWKAILGMNEISADIQAEVELYDTETPTLEERIAAINASVARIQELVNRLKQADDDAVDQADDDQVEIDPDIQAEIEGFCAATRIQELVNMAKVVDDQANQDDVDQANQDDYERWAA